MMALRVSSCYQVCDTNSATATDTALTHDGTTLHTLVPPHAAPPPSHFPHDGTTTSRATLHRVAKGLVETAGKSDCWTSSFTISE